LVAVVSMPIPECNLFFYFISHWVQSLGGIAILHTDVIR